MKGMGFDIKMFVAAGRLKEMQEEISRNRALLRARVNFIADCYRGLGDRTSTTVTAMEDQWPS